MTASASEPCVVFVANRLPVPVDDGWKRRTYHVVRALAAVAPVELVVFGRHGPGAPADDVCLGARVTVHTVRPPAVPRPLALAASYVVPHPMQQLLHTTHALDETLARVAEGRRVIAAGCASVFLAHALQVVRRHADVRFDFIDTHNIDSLYYQRLADHSDSVLRRAAFAQTARRTRSLEADAFARAQETWVCSDDEAARLARDVPQARVRVLPNGATVPPRCPAPPLSGDTVLFFGRLDYEPNADAIRLLCTEIWPRVVAARPTARLRLVGSGDTRAARALAALHPSITLVGRVDDVGGELSACAAVAVPLRSGGGTRLKILEAMAAGRAIVSTPVGAEGIAMEDDVHALLRDDPEGFAAAIVAVLADRERATRIANAAWSLVAECYDWRAVEQRMTDAVRAAVTAMPQVT